MNEDDVLDFDLVTGQMRVIPREQYEREMNAPSEAPRVIKVVLTDGISTKDGCA